MSLFSFQVIFHSTLIFQSGCTDSLPRTSVTQKSIPTKVDRCKLAVYRTEGTSPRSTIVTLRWPGQSFLHPWNRARGGPASREASGTFSASICFITFLLNNISPILCRRTQIATPWPPPELRKVISVFIFLSACYNNHNSMVPTTTNPVRKIWKVFCIVPIQKRVMRMSNTIHVFGVRGWLAPVSNRTERTFFVCF